MKYQNKRGGRIVLQDVQKPAKDSWGTGLDALQVILARNLKKQWGSKYCITKQDFKKSSKYIVYELTL